MGKPEAKNEMYFVDCAELEGIFQRKVEWISRNGCPDRYGACLGRTAYIEFKSEYGELEGHQENEIERMREAGITVFVASNRAEVDLIIQWFLHGTEVPEYLRAFVGPQRKLNA